jgi:divalent metal cation (Fe/Co/Zn/Cd) transporter
VVGVHDRLTSYDEVDSVVELLTMHLGPESVLVAARVDLTDSLSSAQVEEFSERADEDLRQDFPMVSQVFLDATRGDPELCRRTAEHIKALRGGTEQEAPASTAAR